LKIVREIEVPINLEHPNVEHFWQAQSSSGPAKVLIAKFGESKVRETMLNAIQHLIASDGAVHLKNISRVVVLSK
jgi:hypothetical protein